MHKLFHTGGAPLQRATIWVLIALVGLLLQGCGGGGEESFGVGVNAPDFTLQSATVGEVSLTDYKNKQPVLLFFHMADG
jgi:hypothetical protein